MERPEGGGASEARMKVVVVMGSTGVGKSQLAIDLALAHQKKEGQLAEIVNADSMQVYRGFPVATAKVSEEEKAGVVHHLLDVASPTDTGFNVVQYCRLALAAIADIHRRGNLPIVVGGTHYYLEALLWDNVLLHDLDAPLVASKPQRQQPANSGQGGEEEEEGEEEAEEGREQDYKRLTEVDPLTASWLHPHNVRKVKRALEVFDTTGKPYSQMLRQQAPPTPRFDALLFWVDCDRAVLNARLDKRVDKMIQAGLLEEVAELRRAFEREGLPMDYTKGILQAIGYKEFEPYFASAAEAARGPTTEAALETSVAALKRRTRRYAKVQTGWILRHFRPRATIYRVDSTEAEQPKKWNEQVRLPAAHVLDRWLESAMGGNGDGGDEGFAMMRFVEVLRPSSSPTRAGTTKRATSERTNADEEGGGDDCGSEKKRNKKEGEGSDRERELEARWRRFVCDDCNGKVLQGEVQWHAHLKSRGHHHHRKRLRQQQFMAAMGAAVATPNE